MTTKQYARDIVDMLLPELKDHESLADAEWDRKQQLLADVRFILDGLRAEAHREGYKSALSCADDEFRSLLLRLEKNYRK